MKEIGIIIVCLLFNALLVLTEMAFVVVNKPSLRQLVRQGHSRAGVLLRLRETPERTLSVIQIGLTLALALAGVVGGVGAEEDLSPLIRQWLEVSENMADAIAVGLVVLPLTYFTVVLGELVPKSLALRHSLNLALITAPWLSLFEKILGPVVTVLEWSTKRFLSLLRFLLRQPSGESKESESADATVELGLLSFQHRQYVMNLVDLERKRIREIYLPWDKVTAVDVESAASEIEAAVISSGHTRLPVLKDGQVIGILNTKEFAALRASGRADWASLTRPVVELQADTPLLTGLRRLQERRIHMGVVYSAKERLGVVTLEDILEEVVGEIYDEDDDGALLRLLSSGPITRAGRSPTLS
jgi:putative hemolysin